MEVPLGSTNYQAGAVCPYRRMEQTRMIMATKEPPIARDCHLKPDGYGKEMSYRGQGHKLTLHFPPRNS